MAPEIESREDQEDVTGKVGDQDEQAILAQGITLEVCKDKPFYKKGDAKGDGQPNQGITLKEDEQDAVDDAGNYIHQEGDLDAGAGRVPA
jgi:hypothetical protein